MEKISSAAILTPVGVVFGNRRHSEFEEYDGVTARGAEYSALDPRHTTKGFWTTHQRFVSRKQATPIACHAGQALTIRNPVLGLTSDDLVKDYPCETSG